MKKNIGFTLIELVVVMAIISILATVTVLSISPSTQFAGSRNTERSSDVYAILSALSRYSLEHSGNIPTQITADPIAASNLATDLVPNYLDSIPVDPNGGDYLVSVDTNLRITVAAPDAELGATIQVTK